MQNENQQEGNVPLQNPPQQPQVQIQPPTRVPLNNLFKTIVRTNGGAVTIEDFNAEEVQDLIGRETGITRQVETNKKYITGITDPAAYLRAKNDDLKAIIRAIAPSYQTEYNRIKKLGYTDQEARKKATAYVNIDKERRMREHEQRFPTDIAKKATEKLIRTL